MNIPEKIDLNILDDQINTIKVLMLGNKINDLISYLKSKEEGEFNEGCKECQKTTDGRACNFHTKKFYKNVFGTSVLPDTPDKENGKVKYSPLIENNNFTPAFHDTKLNSPDKMEWDRDWDNEINKFFYERSTDLDIHDAWLPDEIKKLFTRLLVAQKEKYKEEMVEFIQKLPLTQILTTKGEVEKSLIDKDVLLTELNK